MAYPQLTAQQQELWTLVRKINNCWYQKNFTNLSGYFHKDVVFNSPDFKHQIRGSKNCIQTYIDFLDNSNILDYFESNPGVEIFEKTAIITYDFEMKYAQKEKIFHETGTDILVFEKEGQYWKVIWRAPGNIKNV